MSRPRAVAISLTDLRACLTRVITEAGNTGLPVFITQAGTIVGVYTPIAGHVASRVLTEMAREMGRTRARQESDGVTRPWEGPDSPAGPAGTPLRDQIGFWLSGTDVPPAGLTLTAIAQQAGAPARAVRLELSAMEALALVRKATHGQRVTWSLIGRKD